MAEPTPAPFGTITVVDADLLGEPAGMQRRAAAEGDHGAGGDVAAALDGMDARGIRHVLVDDLGDAGRGPEILRGPACRRCSSASAWRALLSSSAILPPAK